MIQSATVRLVFCQVTQHTPSVEDCTMSQRDRTNCLTSIYEAGESRSAQSVNESECYATQDRASRELPYALLLHTRVHRHTAKCQHFGSLIFSKKGSGRAVQMWNHVLSNVTYVQNRRRGTRPRRATDKTSHCPKFQVRAPPESTGSPCPKQSRNYAESTCPIFAHCPMAASRTMCDNYFPT